MSLSNLHDLANDMRKDILKSITEAGSGHPGGSLSCIDILTALYFGDVLKYDPKNPSMEGRDIFILSKGHAAPALYTTLAYAGFFPKEELATLRKLGSKLQGHPDSNLLPGVEVGTGSLGQGISIACGCALGIKMNGGNETVFTVLGDGECEEGQVWEAAMFASAKNLDNLVAVIDHNHLQIDGNIADVNNPDDLNARFSSFGWDVMSVDGHNIDELIATFKQLKTTRSGKPHLVIAETVKGKGVSFMENQAGWHGKAPNAEQLEQALTELSN